MKIIVQGDGGGLRGVIPAVTLDRMEESGFDFSKVSLFSGTSVFSIIAALLAAGSKAKPVRTILENEGASLFQEKSIFARLSDPNKAKYNRKPLYDRIEQELAKLGVIYMKDLKIPLAITAFGLYAKKTHYICSWDPRYADIKVVDVVSWSALSAVNYFGKIVVPDFKWTKSYQVMGPYEVVGEVFQDGGQGLKNTTSRDALLTGLYDLGFRKDSDVRMISLGCGSPWMMNEKFSDVASAGWLSQAMDYLTEASREATCDEVESALFIASCAGYRIARIDPIIDKNIYVLDGKKFISEYARIGNYQKLPTWLV